MYGPYPLVFVVLEHSDAVFNDEEEVDPAQCRQALPHCVKLLQQVHVLSRFRPMVVVMRPLRLKVTKDNVMTLHLKLAGNIVFR